MRQACGGDEGLRAEVELLLSHAERVGSFLEQPAIDALTTRIEREDLAGRTINRYALLQKIGEGGMGEVWLAEQREPVRRRVALKIVKAGMNTREVMARFESERQALALMDHPAIAKVFDSGSTPEGAPYFVLEYVAGVPITTYCDNHRLSTNDRLELFIRVCEGVQHAHRKAIIHRDLKPSNILVTEVDGRPVPKIIDFGVAKALSQKLTADTLFTRVGALIGTPEYMSPEQASLSSEEIDKRTDVYSLGIIFYELLAGVPPLELRKIAFEEFLRRLREEDAPKPSTKIQTQDPTTSAEVARKRHTELPALVRQMRGDLDCIALKALEKDRGRRYGSPADFAADIGRYLKHEAVLAVAPSAVYRARKFARRHRNALVTACACVVVLAAAATISLYTGRAQRREEGQRARFVRALQQMEAGGFSEGAGAGGITEEQKELRQTFFQGRLNQEFSLRLARLFLAPDIRVPAYISRKDSGAITAQVNRVFQDWHLVAVVEAAAAVDERPPQAPVLHAPVDELNLLSKEEVRRLSPGQHAIAAEISAWFFDTEEVSRVFGDTLLNPKVESDQKRFEQFWPELKARCHWVGVGPLRFPPKVFQMVDFNVLYTFTGGADGGYPKYGRLSVDNNGNLYGTTAFGGDLSCQVNPAPGPGCGVVIKLDPATSRETVLYRFSGTTHGMQPWSGLLRDPAGNLYGTTVFGGAKGAGVIFEVTPAGHETVLYNFGGANGANPTGDLMGDNAGHLYGTTITGGDLSACGGMGCGVIFSATRSGQLTVLHTFQGSDAKGGANPTHAVFPDAAGNLYGTTENGGLNSCHYPEGFEAVRTNVGGCGTIFRLTAEGQAVTLHRFSLGADGSEPRSALIQDPAGNFYGTTFHGGEYGYGTVFQVSPEGHETILYSFQGLKDGGNPWGGLARDDAGTLYGTTNHYGGSCGCGTVFKLDTARNLTVLYTFRNNDGAYPEAPLLLYNGALYGTTSGGGTASGGGSGAGEIFKIGL